MNPQPPALPQAQHPPPEDSILRGCAMGCGWGILALVISIAIAGAADASGKATGWIIGGSGVLQWLGIVPTILSQRQKHCTLTVSGMIVSGCIGLLLSSLCGTMLTGLGNMH
jgi:hypothetical protein